MTVAVRLAARLLAVQVKGMVEATDPSVSQSDVVAAVTTPPETGLLTVYSIAPLVASYSISTSSAVM